MIAVDILCLVLRSDVANLSKIGRELALNGIRTHDVASLRSAVLALRQWRFDIILVEGDGFAESLSDLLHQLRSTRVPIVLVTAAQDEANIVARMEEGATDVMSDRCSGRIAALRLKKLALLRSEKVDDVPAQFRAGPLLLDTRRRTAVVEDVLLELTGRQFEVVVLLALHVGDNVHRRSISDVMRYCGHGHRGIDMMIYRLRQKLRDVSSSVSIETILGEGYSLRVVEGRAESGRALQLCA